MNDDIVQITLWRSTAEEIADAKTWNAELMVKVVEACRLALKEGK